MLGKWLRASHSHVKQLASVNKCDQAWLLYVTLKLYKSIKNIHQLSKFIGEEQEKGKFSLVICQSFTSMQKLTWWTLVLVSRSHLCLSLLRLIGWLLHVVFVTKPVVPAEVWLLSLNRMKLGSLSVDQWSSATFFILHARPCRSYQHIYFCFPIYAGWHNFLWSQS